MHLSLLLAKIKAFSFCILLCLVIIREKIRVKLALAIPTAAPTTLVNEKIDTPPAVALKTIKILPI